MSINEHQNKTEFQNQNENEQKVMKIEIVLQIHK